MVGVDPAGPHAPVSAWIQDVSAFDPSMFDGGTIEEIYEAAAYYRWSAHEVCVYFGLYEVDDDEDDGGEL